MGGVALLVNYLIFFWINKRRLWKKEDEIFNEKKKQEALQELIETQNLLDEARQDYIDGRAYKNDTEKILKR